MSLIIVVGAAVTLSVVFLAAALAKMRSRNASQSLALEFGIPSALARQLWVLPYVELIVAVSLLIPATVRHGALAALIALMGFTGGILWNLVNGRSPRCGCFGDIGVGEIGATTVVRNMVLIGVAAGLYLEWPVAPEMALGAAYASLQAPANAAAITASLLGSVTTAMLLVSAATETK